MLFERVYDIYRVIYRFKQSIKKHDMVPDKVRSGELMMCIK